MKHDEIAWHHCLAQFSGSLKLEALVRSLYAPLNALQMAYDDLLTVRYLDKAEGVQLDGIGQIVGLPREVDAVLFAEFFGFDGQSGILSFNQARIRREHEKNVQGGIVLDDGQYRRLLHWKIAANNGCGSALEIAAAVKAVFLAEEVRVQDRGNAKIRVWFQKSAATPAAILTDAARWIPRAGGVGIEVVVAPKADKAFGFVSQKLYGFGIGKLVRRIV